MDRIKLDLRTDLAKVTPETLGPLGSCRYTAPCAIGAMLTPEQRRDVAAYDGGDGDTTFFDTLVRKDIFTVPAYQLADFVSLQNTFDRAKGDESRGRFFTTLTELKEKYSA